jgi:hypothetical protein
VLGFLVALECFAEGRVGLVEHDGYRAAVLGGGHRADERGRGDVGGHQRVLDEQPEHVQEPGLAAAFHRRLDDQPGGELQARHGPRCRGEQGDRPSSFLRREHDVAGKCLADLIEHVRAAGLRQRHRAGIMDAAADEPRAVRIERGTAIRALPPGHPATPDSAGSVSRSPRRPTVVRPHPW